MEGHTMWKFVRSGNRPVAQMRWESDPGPDIYMRSNFLFAIAVTGLLTACQSSSTKPVEIDNTTTSAIAPADADGVQSGDADIAAQTPITQDEVAKAAPAEKSTSSGVRTVAGGNVIAAYRPPKVGTVFYWKNNWNSLPKKLTQKVTSIDSSFSGQPAIELDAIDGTGADARTYLDVKSANLLGHKDKNGKPVVVFPKVEERLRFPMKPGDKWLTSWKSVDRSTQKVTQGGGVVKVLGVEKLPVAGKKLKAMKIQLPLPRELARSMKHYIWYSPKFGIVVREQISNGTFVWLKELENVKLPG